MKGSAARLVIGGMVLLAGPSVAADVATPSAEALVVPPYPSATPWKKITDQHDPAQIWFEWIPADQTESDIHDILTEQVIYKLKGSSPHAFLDAWSKRITRSCRDVKFNGPTDQVEQGYPVAYEQVYCVGNVDKDVDIFVKAIAGHDALYIVQREFRRPATPGAQPLMRIFPEGHQAEAEAALQAQRDADGYLTKQVRLCPSGIDCSDATTSLAASPAAPSQTKTPDSVQIDGWPVPGTTSADDVRAKLGAPTVQNHMDPRHVGEYSWVYTRRDGYVFAFLFDKNDRVVRMGVYKYNGPG